VVNWTNEEGSRFAPAMVSSGVFAKVLEKDWAQSRQDRDGMTFAAALDAIGYRGPERCGEHPLSAFFELHIEQGPILEAEGKDIGVVTGVQAMRWYEVTLTGQDAHTGSDADASAQERAARRGALIDAVDASAGSIRRASPPSADREPAELAAMSCRARCSSWSTCGIPTARARCDGGGFRAALPAICEPLG
jgi:N-carbamoyl-L-amino-acid hydrolase